MNSLLGKAPVSEILGTAVLVLLGAGPMALVVLPKSNGPNGAPSSGPCWHSSPVRLELHDRSDRHACAGSSRSW